MLAWGNFLTIVINFLIIAFVLFLAVKGINRLKRTRAAAKAPPRRRKEVAAADRDPRPAQEPLSAETAWRRRPERKLRVVADNRKARFNYFIDETFEAGVALTGTEVKSLRQGKATIAESYADARGGEIWLINSNIPEYLQANRFNHTPKRPRKLLLHKRQINKLVGAVERDGMTLVPLKLYFNEKGRAKVELALARGKKLYDKRETEKKRSWERERGRLLRQKGEAEATNGRSRPNSIIASSTSPTGSARTRSTRRCWAPNWSRGRPATPIASATSSSTCTGPGVKPAEVARLPVAPGNSDLCFEWMGPIADAIAHLERCGVRIEAGPMQRFGAKGAGHQRLFPRSRRLADGIHVLRMIRHDPHRSNWRQHDRSSGHA